MQLENCQDVLKGGDCSSRDSRQQTNDQSWEIFVLGNVQEECFPNPKKTYLESFTAAFPLKVNIDMRAPIEDVCALINHNPRRF